MNDFFEEYGILHPSDFFDFDLHEIEDDFEGQQICTVIMLMLRYILGLVIMCGYYITLIPWLINELLVWYLENFM